MLQYIPSVEYFKRYSVYGITLLLATGKRGLGRFTYASMSSRKTFQREMGTRERPCICEQIRASNPTLFPPMLIMALWMGKLGFELEILADHTFSQIKRGERIWPSQRSKRI